MRVLSSLIVVTALGLLSACSYEVIEGSGQSATEVRELDAFVAIESAAFVDVVVEQGEIEQASVTCDDNLIEYIRTRVEDGKLRIYQPTVVDEPNHFVNLEPRTTCVVKVSSQRVLKIDNSGSGDLYLECDLQHLSTMKSSGSGKVSAWTLAVDQLEVELSGSGDMSLKGAAESLELKLTGSGDAQFADLQTTNAKIKSSGSGDVEVRVSCNIDVDLSGSGDIHVYGRPDVDGMNITGSGRLTWVE